MRSAIIRLFEIRLVTSEDIVLFVVYYFDLLLQLTNKFHMSPVLFTLICWCNFLVSGYLRHMHMHLYNVPTIFLNRYTYTHD